MKFLKQFAIILFVYFLGMIINNFFIPSIPSTVIGMLLLFLLLNLNLIKIVDIKEFSEFLLSNLAFFFIPPSITLMNSWNVLSSHLFKILFIIIITTFLTMIVTGITVDFLIKWRDKNNDVTK